MPVLGRDHLGPNQLVDLGQIFGGLLGSRDLWMNFDLVSAIENPEAGGPALGCFYGVLSHSCVRLFGGGR